MSLDSYSNLQTAIASFLNRADLTSVIPDFITLAETQMIRRLAKGWQEGKSLPRRMVTRNAAFSIDAELVDLPSDFLGPLALSIDDEAIKLVYLKPESMAHTKAQRGTSPISDVPRAYSVVGSQFQFLPSPDTTYTGTLVYWAIPTALSESNTANWILTYHPDVYLYGALTQSAPYLVDDARLTVWGTLFTAAIEDVLNSDPMPNNGAALRTDEALWFNPLRSYGFNINTGDFR